MSGENPTVLVVEDELLIALDIESTLSEAGFNVAVSASCADAKSLLERITPDAVVLDVHLQDGDCATIAKTLVARRIPFIVHTGYDGPDRDEVFRRGTMLGKPSKPDDLVAAVKSLMAADA